MSRKNRKVVMARRVARRWLSQVAEPEYRFKILLGSREYKNLANLLRSFRDGKVAMRGLKVVTDMGISESFDAVTVWSKDREGLVALQGWFEKRGFETSGIW